jgi:hypothetical protein
MLSAVSSKVSVSEPSDAARASTVRRDAARAAHARVKRRDDDNDRRCECSLFVTLVDALMDEHARDIVVARRARSSDVPRPSARRATKDLRAAAAARRHTPGR